MRFANGSTPIDVPCGLRAVASSFWGRCAAIAWIAANVACGLGDDANPIENRDGGAATGAGGTPATSSGAGGSGGTTSVDGSSGRGGSTGTTGFGVTSVGSTGGAGGFAGSGAAGGQAGSGGEGGLADSGGGGSAGDGGAAGGVGGSGGAPPVEHHIGGGCDTDMDCVAGLTCDRTLLRGMCTRSCSTTPDCHSSTAVCFSGRCFHKCPCTRNGYVCMGDGADMFCGVPGLIDGSVMGDAGDGAVPPPGDGSAGDGQDDGAARDVLDGAATNDDAPSDGTIPDDRASDDTSPPDTGSGD
jgi:hypothetical protein